MKKHTLFVIISLTLSLLFGESQLDSFIKAWGDDYSKQEIDFIKTFDGNWLPYNFVEWYKNGILNEKTKEINNDFLLTDLEFLSMSFIKDVVIISFPYGIKTYELSNIENIKDSYKVKLVYNDSSDDFQKKKCITDIWKTNNTTSIFKFEFNKNFLVVTDIENNKKQKYLKISINEINNILEMIKKQNTKSISYFDVILKNELNTMNSSNVSINKTMTVSENLKLRSGEATSTQVLTVMSAGTKVKILELGKAETIDGISSNWVKVEVQKGAKDRDGNPIKAGTVGWCYGGYLK